jgi:lipopolysaccharide/colanic/teichoic acid biosynthesis glycosyltransferase
MTPAQTPAGSLAEAYNAKRLAESYLNRPHLVPNQRGRVFSWQYRYAKRLLDLTGAAVMICIFILPGLLIAAAIFLTSEGPVFYREERIGRNSVPFRIWKFRTMQRKSDVLRFQEFGAGIKSALDSRKNKNRHDPRITRVGGFLRQWSLDELPQVLNVLAGDMSLVGPRPIIRDEADEFGDRLRFYLMAKPGLSGLWQISGRSTIDYAERAQLDATYVRQWNMLTDIQIILRTIPAVLGRVGAW